MRKTFDPKRDEVTWERGRLHNEELYDLYPSPNIIYVIKLNKIKWAEHVARIGDKRGSNTTLGGESEQ